MPSQLQKSLQEYISKIKKPATPQLNLQSKTFSTSTSWILRGCKHPRTPSFSVDREPYNDDAATLSDIDRFLQENFKSLYKEEFNEINVVGEKKKKEDVDHIDHNTEGKILDIAAGCSFDPPRLNVAPTDHLCGSSRFFTAASGSSRSLIEDHSRASSSNSKSILTSDLEVIKAGELEAMSPDDFIAILTYSPSPYNDFRNSMQEMVKARLRHNGKVNWEFMEELLFCYLNLNDKKSYKHILKAFVDMIVVLRENSGQLPSTSIRSKVDIRGKREDVT